jgi:hypothetical protein
MLASDKNICKGIKDNACKHAKDDSWGVGETCACLGFNSKDDAAEDAIEFPAPWGQHKPRNDNHTNEDGSAKDIIDALEEGNKASKKYTEVSSPFTQPCSILFQYFKPHILYQHNLLLQ